MTLLTVLPSLRTNNRKGLAATLTLDREFGRSTRSLAVECARLGLFSTPFADRFRIYAPKGRVARRCWSSSSEGGLGEDESRLSLAGFRPPAVEPLKDSFKIRLNNGRLEPACPSRIQEVVKQ